MDRRANISVIYIRIDSPDRAGTPPLFSGLSYNINKGSFRTGVLRNRGKGPPGKSYARYVRQRWYVVEIVARVALPKG